MSKFDSHAWQKAFKAYNLLEDKEKDKVTLKDLLHTVKVDGKKADKVDIKIGAENDLAIEKDKKGEDVYAKGLTEAPIPRSRVDFSTMNLKSNIDLKWSTTEIMENDLTQWLEATFAAVGPNVVREIGMALKQIGISAIKDGTTGGEGRPSFSDFQKGDRKGI